MITVTRMEYPFTQEQMAVAAEAWGCNCGPSALAFALQKPLEAVRYAILGFEKKGYTSPTMMKAGLEELQAPYVGVAKPNRDAMFADRPALVRIQFTGPWTNPGANPKWAYWHTHWVCCWCEGGTPLVFDCNGGILGVSQWENDIIPLLTAVDKKCDGKWYPTHIWRLGASA